MKARYMEREKKKEEMPILTEMNKSYVSYSASQCYKVSVASL